MAAPIDRPTSNDPCARMRATDRPGLGSPIDTPVHPKQTHNMTDACVQRCAACLCNRSVSRTERPTSTQRPSRLTRATRARTTSR
eukprot:15025536-Alexandrium_andersonii.AAC.1